MPEILTKCGRVVTVDAEDFPLINRISWTIADHGYVKHGEIYLHRLVMGFPPTTDSLVVDHINMNKLDNRKENLRLVSHQRNLVNRGMQSNKKSSIFKGVCRVSKNKSNPWMACITKTEDGIKRTHYLGYYPTAEGAARAYDAAAIRLFGDSAWTNF